MIDRPTLRGYRDTTYAIGPLPDGAMIGLRLGETSPQADRVLRLVGARSLCCLNAWNPRSRQWPVSRNMAAHQRLRRDLAQRGHIALPQLGVPDRAGWRPEPGFAVLDLAPEKAIGLAETYGQYAVVLYRPGDAAELLLSRLALR